MLTGILVGGTDGDDAGPDRDVLIELIAVTHRIEKRGVVV